MIYIREEEKKHRALLAMMKKHKKHRPEIEDMSENEFMKMMKEQAMKKESLLSDLKRGIIAPPPSVARNEKVRSLFGDKLPRIPAVKSRAKISSGSHLDGSWLHSFDKSMKQHIRQLRK
eukprot:CAMPEP_0197559064 /NCGR_PEP_ID=MMETSP1320-20131121/20487_1 /TAXON_ID=91990 /ORGANISM="Bolidomonas sp., Strain RCC2347" /LENGTH=118 /DNA_ID=CAMNT_0043120445 /DNA_START=51 /DNA_END=407 /DNA_ORIENTATION=-